MEQIWKNYFFREILLVCLFGMFPNMVVIRLSICVTINVYLYEVERESEGTGGKVGETEREMQNIILYAGS